MLISPKIIEWSLVEVLSFRKMWFKSANNCLRLPRWRTHRQVGYHVTSARYKTLFWRFIIVHINYIFPNVKYVKIRWNVRHLMSPRVRSRHSIYYVGCSYCPLLCHIYVQHLQKDLKSHFLDYPSHSDNCIFDYVQRFCSSLYRLLCFTNRPTYITLHYIT